MAQTQQRVLSSCPMLRPVLGAQVELYVVGGAGGLVFKQNHSLLGGKKEKKCTRANPGPHPEGGKLELGWGAGAARGIGVQSVSWH